MKNIRLLLIDDNPYFLEAVEFILNAEPCFETVRWAATGDDGYFKTQNLKPDLVLMDLIMPIVIGAETIREIKTLPHSPKVIVLTHHDYAEYRVLAKIAGAEGFLHKCRIGINLLSQIHSLFPHSEEV